MALQPDHTLSIVIPTFNTRELTLRCLDTVFSSAPEGSEVLLVDDGSEDATSDAALASHPRVRVLRRALRGGFTSAANWGLSEARGTLLLLLNSDTEVEEGALAAMVDSFAHDPTLGVAGATLLHMDGSPQWSGGSEPTLLWLALLASGLGPRLSALAGRMRRDRRGRVDWVPAAALATRRDVFERAGPLDEGFALYAQDLDFCTAVRERGFVVKIVSGARVRHHLGATVGRTEGAFEERVDPLRLFADLRRYAAKRHGPVVARRVARVLFLAGWGRVWARSMLLPLMEAKARRRFREDTGRLREAVRAMRTQAPQERASS